MKVDEVVVDEYECMSSLGAKKEEEHDEGVIDIDAQDQRNELLMTTYAKQYYSYYRSVEP